MDTMKLSSPSPLRMQENLSSTERNLSQGFLTVGENLCASGNAEDLLPMDVRIPKSTKIHPVVHWLFWPTSSEQNSFTFNHYLSIQSILKFVQPERIYFYYMSSLPVVDEYNYYSWFMELNASFPFIIPVKLDADPGNVTSLKTSLRHRLYILGGVYVGYQTVITKWTLDLWDLEYKNVLRDFGIGFLMAAMESKHIYSNVSMFNTSDFTCATYNKPSAATPGHIRCITFDAEIFPKDIWNKTDAIHKFLNCIMYNSGTTPTPTPTTDKIPNIAHLFWLGGNPMPFIFYLCVLSLKYIVKVDKVFIFGDSPATGPYWDELISQGTIEYIHIERLSFVYGHSVSYTHAMSDLFRAVVLDKYGGIYSDADVIWTRSIPEHLLYYDAVGSYDWAPAYPPYPKYINLGVTMAKPGSRFFKLMLESMKDFRGHVFGYNGLKIPYKLYERHPGTLYLEEHLQVMCYLNDCYPLWGTNWTKIDWKHDTLAFHWTHPDPQELTSREALLASKPSIFSDMGKFVLQCAGKL